VLPPSNVVCQTHNVALASTVAQSIVTFNGKGNIISHTSAADALKNDAVFVQEFQTDHAIRQKADEEFDQEPSEPVNGKLIVAEEMEEGHVSWDARESLKIQLSLPVPDLFTVRMYSSALGGRSPFRVLSGWLACILLARAILAGQTWFLGYWAWEYTAYPSSDVPVVR
jgi:hypothetical protein